MIRQPPRSTRTATLFPYTPLFRSRVHPVARSFVEIAHLGIGVGENDPAGPGVRPPVTIPTFDQFAARRLARFGSMDHIPLRIGGDRFAGSPDRKSVV